MGAFEGLTRGERVCAFIEHFCHVPEGDLVGQPFHLEPFERDFIIAVYDNPHGTRLAILSIAKKNGKTPLIAAILLAHIAGPEARQNSQIVSGAMSQMQAATVFKYAAKMCDMDDTLRKLVRVRASIKQLIGLPMNVEYRAISRQKKTTQGIAPVVLLLDELGQVRGPQDDFVEGVETAMGAYDDGLKFVISTQAASDSDMLSVWIDDARESKDPHTVCHVHCAENPDCDVLDEQAWRQANPALGIFRSMKDMRELAQKAKRMPTFEASFRNLNLNQRVETRNALIARGVWLANSFPPDPRAFRESPVYGGLDLSGRVDLTSLVLTAFFEGRWHVQPYFWTPAEGIHERARQDRQPYPLWVKQGHIREMPGASIDYDDIATQLREILAGVKDLRAIAYDRWRMDVMHKSLERAGWHPFNPTDKTQSGDLPLVPFGQGFKDMSPAIDETESELMNDRVSHGNHPVLTMCAANSIAIKDEAGNRKLDKKRSTGRIDGMVGMCMAIGTAAAIRRDSPAHQLFSV